MLNKYVVQVAWNREAVDIMDSKGFNSLIDESDKGNHSLFYNEIEFDTEAEAIAYCRGIDDGNGWDSPLWKII